MIHFNHLSKRTRIILALILGGILIGGYAFGFYYRSKYAALTKNPDAEAQKQVNDILLKIGRLTVLPTDDEPSVSIIKDKRAIIAQPIFKNVENGDVILAYQKNSEVIVYRPSTDKIIVATVLVVYPQAPVTQTIPSSTSPKQPAQQATSSTPAKIIRK